MISLYIGECGG